MGKDSEKIDHLDKKILSILSNNARMPFKDVAAECGVSRAAVHQRVQHLIENGVITGSSFNVNPKSLGYSTCTYIGLNLERGSMYKKVVEQPTSRNPRGSRMSLYHRLLHDATQAICPRQRTTDGLTQQPHTDDCRCSEYRNLDFIRSKH